MPDFDAYAAKIDAILASVDRLSDAQLRAALAALNDARAGIIDRLVAAAAGGNTYSATVLATLITDVQRIGAEYELRLGQSMEGALRRAWDIGASTLPDAWTAAGIGETFRIGLDTRLLDIASQLTADLVRDVSQNFITLVSREIRLGALGALSVQETMRRVRALLATQPDRLNGRFGPILSQAERIVRTECLPGDTLVDSAVVRAAFRRWYDGDMAEITTAAGRKLSATPNHPMLTQRGWLPAHQVTEGDHLVCDTREQRAGPPCDQHVQRSPATIREIFDSLEAVGIAEWVRGSEPDFHGDGREGYVDVLRPGCELRIGAFAALYEPVVNLLLPEAHLSGRAPLCAQCGRLLAINEPTCFCDRAQATTGLFNALLYGAAGHTDGLRNTIGSLTGEVAAQDRIGVQVFERPGVSLCGEPQRAGLLWRPGDSGRPELAYERPAGDGHRSGNLQDGHPVAVQLDRVVNVRLRAFRGHVYNLETPYGYFTISGAYTGNCMRAYSLANEARMRQAFEMVPGLRKYWLATPDARTRETHLQAWMRYRPGGTVGPIPVKDDFIVGGFPAAYPYDPRLPARETVNCRCRSVSWHPDWFRKEEAA